MIIRADETTLLLVTQPDHAQLARQVMDHWVAGGFSSASHRTSILHAIGEHDNGWQEVDAAPIVEAPSGRLLDFVSAALDVRQGVWPRGVERLAADPVAAALVCEHAIQIYRRLWDDPAWTTFFTRMDLLRTTFAGAAQVPLSTIERDYFFVRIADLISLTFCAHWQESAQAGMRGTRSGAPATRWSSRRIRSAASACPWQ